MAMKVEHYFGLVHEQLNRTAKFQPEVVAWAIHQKKQIAYARMAQKRRRDLGLAEFFATSWTR